MLIKQAEASSLAEDEAIGGRVVLDGDNWQEAARWEEAGAGLRCSHLLWDDSRGRGGGSYNLHPKSTLLFACCLHELHASSAPAADCMPGPSRTGR